jgi:lipoprotein-anchoring transpeptidase ErfK/SrfK
MRLTTPLSLALALALGACGLNGTDRNADEGKPDASKVAANDYTADPMVSHDPTGSGPLDPALADDTPRPLMQAQVVLDRLGFAPGVIDGKEGLSTTNAIEGFQKAQDIEATGKLDEATKSALEEWANIPATRVVTIPESFAAGPFYAIPDEPADQAKMPSLSYASLDEKLAERFHTTVAVLKQLNPGGVPAGLKPASATLSPTASASGTPTPTPTATASGSTFTPTPGPASTFHAGQQIRVPNIGGDAIDAASVSDKNWLLTLAVLGVGTNQPKADKIVVDKSDGTLQAFDASGKLVAQFTATMGSKHDPLPLGDWKILGVSRNTPFNYNPDLFWDAKAGDEKAKLPPGPNGPVGVVWIDLSKEHYGIHGTPNPETIGRAESHGCVRLTNWDAARLAQMVSTSTKVSFVA